MIHTKVMKARNMRYASDKKFYDGMFQKKEKMSKTCLILLFSLSRGIILLCKLM